MRSTTSRIRAIVLSSIQFTERCNIKVLFMAVVILLLASQMLIALYRFAGHNLPIAGHDLKTGFSGSESYSHIAQNIVRNRFYSADGVRPTAWRPPLYPMFLASMILTLGNDYYAAGAIVLQLLMAAGCGVLIFLISLRMFENRLAAAISVLIYSLYADFHFETLAKRETVLFTLLLLLFFYFLLKGKKSVLDYAALSSLSALGYLTKPTGILLFPLLIISLFLLWREAGRRAALAETLLAITMVSIIVTPWHAYIYRHFATFSFMPSSTSGLNLYKGNNPQAYNYYPLVDVDSFTPYILELLEEHDIDADDEAQADQFLKRQAVSFIKNNPFVFLKGAVVKFLAFYSPYDTPLGDGKLEEHNGRIIVSEFKFPRLIGKILFAFYKSLIFAGTVMFFRNVTRYSKAQKMQMSYVVFFIVLVTLLHQITFAETRFRLPLDPFFVMFAGEFYSARIRTIVLA